MLLVHPWAVIVAVFTAIWCLAYLIVMFRNPSTWRAFFGAVFGTLTALFAFIAYGLL